MANTNLNKSLGEAELEIMQIVWGQEGPVSAPFVAENLKKRQWAVSTVVTAMNRICAKGFLHCDRSTRQNLYTPLISEQDYKIREGRSFVDRLHKGSMLDMVATFYQSTLTKEEDIAELRKLVEGFSDDKGKPS